MLILIGFCAGFAIMAAYITDLFLRDRTGFAGTALAVILGIATSLAASFAISFVMDLLVGFDFFVPAAIGSVFGPIAMAAAAKRVRRKPLPDGDLRR
jgi:hypothetical protein